MVRNHTSYFILYSLIFQKDEGEKIKTKPVEEKEKSSPEKSAPVSRRQTRSAKQEADTKAENLEESAKPMTDEELISVKEELAKELEKRVAEEPENEVNGEEIEENKEVAAEEHVLVFEKPSDHDSHAEGHEVLLCLL